MMRSLFILHSVAFILWACMACTPMTPTVTGSITLSLSTDAILTRAGEPGDGNVTDGGGIWGTDANHPDLKIFIADESGAIVARYLGEDSSSARKISNDFYTNRSTQITVQFTWESPLGAGNYTVYALANLGGTGGNLSIADPPTWDTFTDASVLDGLKFSALASQDPPAVGDRMPLSAKGSIRIYLGSDNEYHGQADLALLRCLAKVQLRFKNLTGGDLDLANCQFTIHDMNVRQGYVLSHDPDFVELGDIITPTDGKDDCYAVYIHSPESIHLLGTDDPATDIDERTLSVKDDPSTTTIDETELAAFDPVLFFPSVAPMQEIPSHGKRYLCDISFDYQSATKSFTNLPIHDKYSQDILYLARNQFLQIETTISQGEVSFNFVVSDWETRKEFVLFH